MSAMDDDLADWLTDNPTWDPRSLPRRPFPPATRSDHAASRRTAFSSVESPLRR